MLLKATVHANWTLTNEYPPFYNEKKSTSKIVVQKGRRVANQAWLWDSQPRMVGTMGMEKSKRIDFSYGKWSTRSTKTAKSVQPYVQVPGELVRIFFVHFCASCGPFSMWKFNSSRFFHSHATQFLRYESNWQMLTKGGGEVRQMLTIADEGGGG